MVTYPKYSCKVLNIHVHVLLFGLISCYRFWQKWSIKGESRKKITRQCVNSLFFLNWNFLKSPWEHYISKLYIYIFLYFQNYNYKNFMKFTVFQELFYIKALEKSMWTNGFFVLKIYFIYQIFKWFQFFCELKYIPHKGSMCSKHSRKKNTYIILDLNIRMSFYIIMVLNL